MSLQKSRGGLNSLVGAAEEENGFVVARMSTRWRSCCLGRSLDDGRLFVGWLFGDPIPVEIGPA
jgi:hypothetical protein